MATIKPISPAHLRRRQAMRMRSKDSARCGVASDAAPIDLRRRRNARRTQGEPRLKPITPADLSRPSHLHSPSGLFKFHLHTRAFKVTLFLQRIDLAVNGNAIWGIESAMTSEL